jgi:TolA-binding protein
VIFPADSCAAAEKILESVKIGSFKEKSRVVLQLSSVGFYEVDNKPDDAILLIKLFDFSRGKIPPRQLVDERLIKGIHISQEEQYLQVRLSLTTSQYHYRAHLFKSPPMLVIDLKSRQVTPEEESASINETKKSDEQAEIQEPEPDAAEVPEEKSLTVPETGATSKPETAEMELIKSAKTDIAPPATINSTALEAPIPEKSISSESRSVSSAANELLTDKPIAEKPESGPSEEKIVSTSAAEIEADPGRKLYEQGLQHYLKGELEEAMETFSRLVTLFPHSSLVPKALFRYNDVLARQENSGNSHSLHHLIDKYLKVVRKYPHDSDAPWALLQVGRAYESMGFDYEAEGVYQALVYQYPQSRFAAAAWYETARINYVLKRYRKALHAYQQLVEKYPERGFSAEAEFYQANCFYHLGDFTKALSRYQSALKRTPEYLQTDPRTIYLLGSCYLSLKKYQQARDYLLLMRNLFPENDFTNLALAKVGDSLLTQGKFAEGVAFLATVIKEYPETDGEIIARLAIAWLGNEKPGLAGRPELRPYAEFLDPQQAYRLIAEKYPDNSLSNVARLRLGRLFYKQRDYAGARQLFGQLILPQVDHDIRSVALAEMRKVIYDELREDYKQKKYAAMVALQKRYDNNFLPRPTGMYPFFWLAEAMRHQGLYAGALKLYGSLQGFKPSQEEFLAITWGMVSCHLFLGEVKDAAGLLQPLTMDDLENSWWIKMMLLKAEIMVKEGENPAALKLSVEIRSRLPARQITERVSLMTMMGEAYSNEGEIDAAIASYREAVSLANVQPQMVDVAHRVTLTSALARILFVKGDYQASLARFRQASLLMHRHENLAELLYWQSLCHARLGQKKELDKIINTLKSRYKNSDWTSLAISNLKDYQWKTGSRNLQ